MNSRESCGIVLGAGVAGMLAAAVLADHTRRVLLIDRDTLPREARPRRGIPQGAHAHVFMSSGARAVETIIPGVTERWIRAGARRIGLPSGYVLLMPQGWMPRLDGEHFVISCTRPLLDWTIREQVLADPRIETRDETEVLELVGDHSRITGVRLRDRRTGRTETVATDLVVDATGRGSRADRWLAELGAGTVRERVVDSGLAYATRLYAAPVGTGDQFPVVNVQADPDADGPGRTGALMPVENDAWLVTLSGTRGGQPTSDPDRFVEFARNLRHPVVGDLIADAEPIGDVRMTHSTANRRRFFEELPRWPAGMVILGDALASYNPVYGHGMSVAAQGALALRDGLARRDARDPQLARLVQRAVGRLAANAWDLATSTDIRFPGAIGAKPTVADNLAHRYSTRLMAAAASRPHVGRALIDVMTLSAPATRLLTPSVVLGGVLGPKAKNPGWLPEPPLRGDESAGSPS